MVTVNQKNLSLVISILSDIPSIILSLIEL
jgi:hypothetical protein